MSYDEKTKKSLEGHPNKGTEDQAVVENRKAQDMRRHVHPKDQTPHEGGY